MVGTNIRLFAKNVIIVKNNKLLMQFILHQSRLQFAERTCGLPFLLLYDWHCPPDRRECLESPAWQLARHLQRETVGHFDEVAKHVSHCDVFCIAVEAEGGLINIAIH